MKSKGLFMLTLSLVILIQISSIANAQPPSKPEKGGPVACLLGCCLGRVGLMYNEGVGIRMWEVIELLFAPARLLTAYQAYQGKTWTEIEAEEGLRDPDFKKWHVWMVRNKVYK